MKLVSDLIVFWDIDGTIVRPSLESMFLKYMRSTGATSHGRIAQDFVTMKALHLFSPWHKAKLAYLRNRTTEEIDRLVESFFDQVIRDHFVDGAVDAIQQLHNDGIRQVLLSGTPLFLARRLAADLQIQDFLAAIPEVIDGKFTGSLTCPHPRGKRKLICADNWLIDNRYNWGNSVAIADHHDDHYLLEQSSTGVVVNPDRLLRQLADDRGWAIIDGPTDFALLVSHLTKKNAQVI